MVSLNGCGIRAARSVRDVAVPRSRITPTAFRLPLAGSSSHPISLEAIPRRSSHQTRASAADVADLQSPPVLGPGTRTQTSHKSAAAPHDRAATIDVASSSEASIRHFFDAFNRRDLQEMADCIAEDVEHCNLAYAKPYPKGKNHVIKFYKSFVDAVPRSARFVIEDTTGTNSSGTIGVIWHLEIRGTVVPNSSGVSFFRLDSQNRITYVRESPEHFTKITSVALPTLSVLSPLLSLAEPLMQGNKTSSAPHPPCYPPASQPQSGPAYEAMPPTSQAHNNGMPSEPSPAASPAPISAPVDALPGSNVAMRTLIPSSDAKAAAAASAAGTTLSSADSTDSAVFASFGATTTSDLEPSDLEASGRASAPTPVLTGRQSVEPRVHNGYAPSTPHPAPSVPAARGDAPCMSSQSIALGATSTESTVQGGDPVPIVATGAAAPRFAGVWQKDQTKCDRRGYERALELMGLGGVQKATALGLEGMEVQYDEAAGVFETFFLTPVPFFKVRERYVLGGAESRQSRRDLRGGQQIAKAWLKDGRVVTQLSWGPQQGGTGSEEFWVDENDQLHVKSTVTVNGQSSTTVQVYSRQDAGGVDSRYYAPKREIPFGIDPNKVSEGILGNFLS